MKKRIIVLFILFLVACANEPETFVTETAIVATHTAQPTSTPEPTNTPEPTSTPEPTNQPDPTHTLQPTSTSEPTNTPEPTSTSEPTTSSESEPIETDSDTFLAGFVDLEDRFAGISLELLLEESFDDVTAWENYSDNFVKLFVDDGAYHIQTNDNGFIWGLNAESHTDVIIEVNTAQFSTHENNAYGVMCRADPSNNGNGYYFLISSDGYYTISKRAGDDVTPLLGWTIDSAINRGQARNIVQAICIGDYLAIYVNGEFLVATFDTTYTDGYAGLAAAAFAGGKADISFDDLTIFDVSWTNE